MKHYIIGDVHGYYNTLMQLVVKLPSDAKLIFVGDLIDRGSQSEPTLDSIKITHATALQTLHLCRA